MGVGFFAAVRVNQRHELAFWLTNFFLFGEYPFYDCSGPHCVESAVHFRRARDAAVDYRAARDAAHADRHFPGYPDPRDRRGLAIYRLAAGPDVGTNPHAVRAVADDHGQRHRTHRRELL